MGESVAVALLPPPHIRALIDPLRSTNDKSYARGWTSHITILFPFTPTLELSAIVSTLQSSLWDRELQPFDVTLDKVSRFSTRDYETTYLGLSQNDSVHALYNICAAALNHPRDSRPYTPHMTIGQTARNSESIGFLRDKGNKILEKHQLTWQIDAIALLRRRDEYTMEMCAQIPLRKDIESVPRVYALYGTPSYHYDGDLWVPGTPSICEETSISLATYNVLHDPAFPLKNRVTSLCEAIMESDADIICLQEVSDEFLFSLLSRPEIRERFKWCSRPEIAVMESERNVVLLAREEFGFEWTSVDLGTKHKEAVVAHLRMRRGSVAIAGIHLTAGRASMALEKKLQEITNLVAYLQSHHSAHDWIVMGDTNWPDSEPFPFEEELTDVWSDPGGGTYDPTTNSLAAVTARESRGPQRYDRIFVRTNGLLSVVGDSSQIFALPLPNAGPASDHWGLKSRVQFNSSAGLPSVPTADDSIILPILDPIPTNVTDKELHDVCADHGCLTSDAQNTVFKQSVETLRQFIFRLSTHDLTSDTSSQPPAVSSIVKFVLAPVGSYAMGYHTPESDVDCVVVGNINPMTFWNLMRSKINSHGTVDSIRLRRFVKDASVQMMELEVLGVKMDVQYCPAGWLIDQWNELSNTPRDSPLFALPVSTLRTLNAYRDALTLKKALPSLENFRLAHHGLKLFLKNHGLIGARFGYLGGFHLAFLIARICLLLPPSVSPAEIVRMFFHTYSHWDWANDAATVPIAGVNNSAYRRNMGREPMCILSIEKPSVNMMINASHHSLETIKMAFQLANRAFEEGLGWRDICVGHGETPFSEFLKLHKSFIRIDVNYWGHSCMKGRALVGWLESRFVNLLVHLHNNVPSLGVRFWPSRFSDNNVADGQNLNGFYLFGLTSTNPVPQTDEEKQSARRQNAKVMSILTTTLRAFENDIHQNARYYDPVDTYICVANVGRAQLPSDVVLDSHTWADNGFDDDGSEDSSDDEGDDPDLHMVEGAPQSTESSATSRKKKDLKGKATPHLLASKLRTSSDVYNRLMWDPTVSSADYVIGYEDRFKGVKEMPLGSWKREVEDEAFIPFHRVVHFRRKTDNVLIWDRKNKIDLVFGSGVSKEEGRT